ncbi:hypothetical protein BDA99DRAFT_571357 [Phascolomyces articulosus]|uniref:Uncharacterized protein n=1 Tax=Phascolomyces articulosus TaxID=60185 RepID=A0AAD5PET5_9FUNG|nr:hypothetical protein BDA99DRAFT_571357 [Phascolomyces articulosus]
MSTSAATQRQATTVIEEGSSTTGKRKLHKHQRLIKKPLKEKSFVLMVQLKWPSYKIHAIVISPANIYETLTPHEHGIPQGPFQVTPVGSNEPITSSFAARKYDGFANRMAIRTDKTVSLLVTIKNNHTLIVSEYEKRQKKKRKSKMSSYVAILTHLAGKSKSQLEQILQSVEGCITELQATQIELKKESGQATKAWQTTKDELKKSRGKSAKSHLPRGLPEGGKSVPAEEQLKSCSFTGIIDPEELLWHQTRKERQYTKESSAAKLPCHRKKLNIMMLIGQAEMGYNTFLKGRPRRGGKQFRKEHHKSTTIALQNEHMPVKPNLCLLFSAIESPTRDSY